MTELKKVYAAIDEQTALSELENFDEKWSGKYPKIAIYGVATGRIHSQLEIFFADRLPQ